MARTTRKVRNYLVVLVVRKSGAGKHRDKKRESKAAPIDAHWYRRLK